MEILFSPSTQTLTLTLIPRSTHSPFSVSRLPSIGPQFLGFRHHSPASSSRRKKWRRIERMRLAAAYLDPDQNFVAVAAAAAAAFSAAVFLYSGYYLRRNESHEVEEEEKPETANDEEMRLHRNKDSLAVELLELPSLSLLDEDVHQEPITMSHSVSALQVGSHAEKTEVNIVLPSHKYQMESTSSVSSDAFREAGSHEIINSEKVERQLVSCISHGGMSGSEEHYLFDKTNLSVLEHSQVSHGVTMVSSPDSLLANHNFLGNAMTRATHSLQEEHLAAGLLEELRPFGYKDGPSHDIKASDRDTGTMVDRGTGILFQEGHIGLIDLPHLLELHVNGKRDISERFSSYNDLLKDGRVTDCVELLEGMDREGVLDMNKVYHAKFLGICRHQKAVKEAFRFTKLIPNPTLSTFNLLMSVCATAQDSEGAFQVKQLVHDAGFRVDCKLYTTLISTLAKSGKVDQMFEVLNEMVNSGVEPNLHTYGALIDGCARAGQIAKAFGAYGILRSKNVKPDRVVFNALITACGHSGALDRAFDVLAEMTDEPLRIVPDHVTVGALIKACMKADQVDRMKDIYKMIRQYNIKGTPEVYTIAVNSCSKTGDWEFACSIHEDMKENGVVPDEMFFSALIDVAGHAGNLDAAFEVLREARVRKRRLGIMVYSSLMGACSNNKNWRKALEVYEEIRARNLNPTVATMNALITALCDGDQLHKTLEPLTDMNKFGLCPNRITYSVLFAASEKKDDLDFGLTLHSRAKTDGVPLNLVMRKCIIAMCARRYEKATMLGDTILDVESGHPKVTSEWTSIALTMYKETIRAGVIPSLELVSQVLGCLKLPQDASLRQRLTECLGVDITASTNVNIYSLIDGFGEYDPRAFSLLEEAASLGLVPCVSFKSRPIHIDASNLCIHTAEVYLLTVFRGLKHRLAAGAKLPNVTISLPVERAQVVSAKGEKTISVAARISQAVGALLRRLRINYNGNESQGNIKISGLAVRRWLQPKVVPPLVVKQPDLGVLQSRLGRGIRDQQRNIRTENLSFQ